ncbi:MAG: 16S rRNA (uracil(1498)-N(3))-methyltransferase [Armatimonadetes bacterium]|nr:16S rRNA (uracil(1498)-N(3))-methyltransferase [Armatimonadota bacterium]
MGGGDFLPVRALPRAFVGALPEQFDEDWELPKEEFDKFHKVLRLSTGDQVALLPGDGRLLRCRLRGRGVELIETLRPDTEPVLALTLALALPKPEKLEESVRMATELGAKAFVLFPSDRSVVRWEAGKAAQKTERLARISREAAEVSFRTSLPTFRWAQSLESVLNQMPEAVVLSEVEGVSEPLAAVGNELTVVVGPEGGWAPREVALIGSRAVGLGPRVLRVDTAVAAACAILLCAR